MLLTLIVSSVGQFQIGGIINIGVIMSDVELNQIVLPLALIAYVLLDVVYEYLVKLSFLNVFLYLDSNKLRHGIIDLESIKESMKKNNKLRVLVVIIYSFLFVSHEIILLFGLAILDKIAYDVVGVSFILFLRNNIWAWLLLFGVLIANHIDIMSKVRSKNKPYQEKYGYVGSAIGLSNIASPFIRGASLFLYPILKVDHIGLGQVYIGGTLVDYAVWIDYNKRINYRLECVWDGVLGNKNIIYRVYRVYKIADGSRIDRFLSRLKAKIIGNGDFLGIIILCTVARYEFIYMKERIKPSKARECLKTGIATEIIAIGEYDLSDVLQNILSASFFECCDC